MGRQRVDKSSHCVFVYICASSPPPFGLHPPPLSPLPLPSAVSALACPPTGMHRYPADELEPDCAPSKTSRALSVSLAVVLGPSCGPLGYSWSVRSVCHPVHLLSVTGD